jgi:hypothetical protein
MPNIPFAVHQFRIKKGALYTPSRWVSCRDVCLLAEASPISHFTWYNPRIRCLSASNSLRQVPNFEIESSIHKLLARLNLALQVYA